MAIKRKRSAETQMSLLAAAGQVFAEKGYRDATVEEISRRAGANIAAVNYHFGDKKTLYAEAWRHSFAESIRAHPPDGGAEENAPPQARLRGAVCALLHRIADEDNREFLIVIKERANPTGLLNEVMRKDLHPQFLRLEKPVGELLGPNATEQQVHFCTMSLISQCLDGGMLSRASAEKWRGKDAPPSIEDIEAFAAHVVRFSLAGINATRKEAERDTRTHRPSPKRDKWVSNAGAFDEIPQ
jgi:TetR/AcrR family transcriptional regulator, regulator of cefoperazone and chloramphenicol sensitivity